MCGIVACRTGTDTVSYLLPALRRLEYRGYDSVGIAVRTVTGGTARLRTVNRIDALDTEVTQWAGPDFDGAGIGHTRWATHGHVTIDNAHPHADCSGRITIVHNGIIENADALRRGLAAQGHRFASTVDSEVIAHLVEDQLRGDDDLPAAVRAATSVLEGSWAVAVLDAVTGRVVVTARRSPLLVARTPLGDFAASDIAAIGEWVDQYRVLADGAVVELLDAAGAAAENPEMSADLVRCIWGARDTDLGSYVDHMAKEIDEQPAAAARLLDDIGDHIADGRLWQDTGLPPFTRLQVLGCGTSLNAGHVLAILTRRLGGVPAQLSVASEAGGDIVEPGTLCLAMSQSGETADVLQALGRYAGGDGLLALTNSRYSTLARHADAVVDCSAGPEIGVAATKTFVCQVVAGSAVLISALVATGRIPRSTARALADDLKRLPGSLASAVALARDTVPAVTESVSDATGFLFIGRGTAVPYAAEGALKLKELTYRWAEHYPAGELKHGPLALIGSGTPVVALHSGDRKLAANIAEVQTRGGRVISVGPTDGDIPVPGDPAAPWGPLESVVGLQMLARTLGLALGWDVDKPRNLAKSVTVE
jgi:glutamine---fructose-6-phosphate transaminase (isomerizing)